MVKKSSSSKSTKSNSTNEFSGVKFIRLTNGEDLVADVKDIANGQVKIHYPLKIVYTPSINPGYLAISLMQWVFTRLSKEQDFVMDQQNILIISEPDIKLKDHYVESVDTFNSKESSVTFENVRYEEDEEDTTVSPDDGLEMIKNILDKLKKDKGSLH